jgi:signal transduction histidine kinase
VNDQLAMRTAVDALADSERRLRALAARLQTAIEEERTRIAREVHDELGQQLTALRLDLAFVLRRSEQGAHAQVVERVHAMIEMVDTTVDMVRRIATRLRPGVLDLGLVPTIEWQAREFTARYGIAVDLELPDELDVAPDHATALFRVLQEVLANVARHAEAERVTITLEPRGADLVLEVLDDGRGITAEQASSATSLGLVGMRERVGIFSGRMAFRQAPAGGTLVTASIPLAAGAS